MVVERCQARLGELLLGELRTMGGWEERNPPEKVTLPDPVLTAALLPVH